MIFQSNFIQDILHSFYLFPTVALKVMIFITDIEQSKFYHFIILLILIFMSK